MSTSLFRAITRLDKLQVDEVNTILSPVIHWYYAQHRSVSIQEDYNAFEVCSTKLSQLVFLHNLANGLFQEHEIQELSTFLKERMNWPVEVIEHTPGSRYDDHCLRPLRVEEQLLAIGSRNEFLYAHTSQGLHYLLYRQDGYNLPYFVSGFIRGEGTWPGKDYPEELRGYEGIKEPLWENI